MAVAKPEVLIFGHSFIKRLARDVNDQLCSDLLENFGLSQCIVTLLGLGKLAIHNERARFYSRIDSVFRRNSYDIVVCQLGGNDISPQLEPLVLAKDLVDFGAYLIGSWNVKVVYICNLFTRLSPRDISPDNYEIRRSEVNNHLLHLLECNSQVKLWKHKRIFDSPLQIFDQDGVHMNAVGQKKFYKSLRQAIIFAVEDFYQLS